MANNNMAVIALSSWVILALGYGAFSLQITTNPVELWASPSSQSRVEKDFFETRFQPFYRTEQIFLKSVGLKQVLTLIILIIECQQTLFYFQFKYNLTKTNETITFGPAFNRTFLEVIVRLQDKIEKVLTIFFFLFRVYNKYFCFFSDCDYNKYIGYLLSRCFLINNRKTPKILKNGLIQIN